MNWGLNSVFMDTKTIVTHIILCVQLPIKHISKNEMMWKEGKTKAFYTYAIIKTKCYEVMSCELRSNRRKHIYVGVPFTNLWWTGVEL